MVSTVLERAGTRLVHNRAGANMVGGVASALAAAARRGGRELDGDLGLFEVDEFWLGAGRRGARAARDPALQPVPRPARPLRRAGHHRRPLGRAGGAPRRPLRRSCSTPTTRWSPTSGRAAGALYFGVEDDALALPELQHASDSKHCRRCGHAYVYETVYLAHLGRYHCPNCGQRRPEPAVVGRDVELRGIRSAAFTLTHGGESHRVELPLPGLYNVYNALGAAALCLALEVPLADVAAGLAGRRPGVRARGDDRPRRAPDLDPARQEPRRRQRGPAHAHARGPRPRRLRRAQRPHRRRPRRLLGLGRRLGGARPARAADDLLGHARRRARAADEVRGRRAGPAAGGRGPRGRARRRARRTATGPLYALPTYTALLELRELLARRGQAKEYWR